MAASQYHKSSEAEDFREWIAPHIPVNVSSTDYFNGTAEALDIIIEIIETTGNRKKK